MFGFITAWKRRRLVARPFPEEWLKILHRRVAFFLELPAADRTTFLDKLKVFVWEKHWIPAGGMEITDEVKVTIAAAAVRLSLHLEDAAYDRLTEIVIYPYVYQHAGTDGAILGEAHAFGTVVLSWPAVQQGLVNQGDGHETAGHEFAHVLDRADGTFDGTPELHASEHYRPWGAIMGEHFARLQADAPDERRVLRRYGATNPVEFFAVATESFFEKPRQMKERTPDLYEELRQFYGSDPAATFGTAPEQPGQVGRNDPCPCGSGKKLKKCCGAAGS